MEKVFLAKTAAGADVYVGEETYEHMKAHPDVSIDHIKEAIEKSDYSGPFKMENADLGRTIGKDNCVEIAPGDNVEELYRLRRDGATPFVDKEPADTSKIVVGMALDDDGKHTMFTAFYGQLAPKEPWDKTLRPEEKAESEKFWSTHALAKDSAGNWKKGIDWERSQLEASKESALQKTKSAKSLDEIFDIARTESKDDGTTDKGKHKTKENNPGGDGPG